MPDNLTPFDREIRDAVRKGYDTISRVAKLLNADSMEVAVRVRRMVAYTHTLNYDHRGRLYVQERL